MRGPPQINSKRNFFFNFSLTIQLIIVNVILFFVSLILVAIYGESFLNNFALVPSSVVAGATVWSILTSMFMHAGFFHLFANMFSLFFVGSFLEKIIGRKRFFWLFIIAGLVGGAFYVGASYIFGGIDVPAVGASGAIFGLLGVLAVLVPRSKIYLIVGPLIIIVFDVVLAKVLPVSTYSILSTIFSVLIIIMIFSMFSFRSPLRKIAVPVELPMWVLPIVAIVPLALIGLFIDLPIGNSAHLGGLVAGLIYGFYLRKKFPHKTARLSRMFGG